MNRRNRASLRSSYHDQCLNRRPAGVRKCRGRPAEEWFREFVEKAEQNLPNREAESNYYDPGVGIGHALLALAIAVRGLWKH